MDGGEMEGRWQESWNGTWAEESIISRDKKNI